MSGSFAKKIAGTVGGMLFSAAVVVCLFALQAVSVSKPKNAEEKPAEIRAVASVSPRETPHRQAAQSGRFDARLSGASSGRTLEVNVPHTGAAAFALPNFSLSESVAAAADIGFSQFPSDADVAVSTDIFELDMLDKIPRRLDSTRIAYPKQMLKRGIEGDVRLSVVIDTTGAVSVERVVSSTNSFFLESAVRAAEKFVYEAPTRNGRAVRAKFILPIPFRISK